MPHATDAFWTYRETGKHTLATGEEYMSFVARQPLAEGMIHPEYGVTLSMYGWPDVVDRTNESKLTSAWAEFYGYKYPMDMLKAEDKLAPRPLSISSFIPPLTDVDLDLMRTSINDMLVAASWKMVFAKDEASFDALWKSAVSDAKNLGADQVQSWIFEQIKEAKVIAAAYEE
ncbi:MAG: hypothetical protein GXY61_14435 [Lentisphaerae bacterium]|nr:hypothetical protein [Lentisphaerota bacterium]